VIGFNGTVPNGLILLPDRRNMVFALGSTVIIREVANSQCQRFLQGHTDRVTCIAVSPSGRFLASGQITYMGYQADVIVWDLSNYSMVHRMKIHKVKVEALSFSPSEKYLASIGGDDDKSLIIWDLETGKAVCGSPASNETVHCVSFSRTSDFHIITAGKLNMRTWEFDLASRKVRPTDCNLGKLQRTIRSMYIDHDDETCYVGTMSGDILIVNLRTKLFKHVGPKNKFSQGVQSLAQAPNGHLIVGAGDGTVATLLPDSLKQVKSTSLPAGGITSVAPHSSNQLFFVGTEHGAMYVVKYESFTGDLRATAHCAPINDVVFPRNYSELFATCTAGEIRIWNSRSCAELLRIQVPGLDCTCIAFSNDGKSILSGWSDGRVRAFGPQSGRLLYVINDAHVGGVTAIACCTSPEHVVTGGADGSVRVWRITSESRTLLASMKEHKATVNCIRVRRNDSECVSAASDGSAIIWDMKRFARNNSLFASTLFRAVLYHPDESQLLTTGTDRKVLSRSFPLLTMQITNWDAYDGSAIRIVDGSQSAEVNSLDISSRGDHFVSAGGDKLVKVTCPDLSSDSRQGVAFRRRARFSYGRRPQRHHPQGGGESGPEIDRLRRR
jgi:cilia- and flagella-associated protein 52